MLSSFNFQLLFVSVASILSAGIILALTAWIFDKKRMNARQLLKEVEGQAVFLFDDTDLIDATPEAQRLFGDKTSDRPDWEHFLALLSPRYPELRSRLEKLADESQITIHPKDDETGWIEAEYWDGLARITLHDSTQDAHYGMSAIAIDALEDELNTLRSLAEDAPQLIWKQEEEGAITWANRAYLTLADALHPSATPGVTAWPPAKIFETIGPAPAHGQPSVRRVAIRIPGATDEDWFEVTSMRRGTGSIHFAMDSNSTVRAEVAQRHFVQTLTKTFANLSTGIAIFDRQRKLVMFNPALLDLTNLPVEFLSARPQIQAMLDRLREGRMLPEPKDYVSWRDQMTALENAATNGTYSEHWTLPGGQTYRVTGRPHPDGAIAFLFEDISAEISLTRRFRSEIELGHAVLDQVQEAIAVFSGSGTLTMTNKAYRELWESLPETTLTDIRLTEELHSWQNSCTPSSVWVELRGFLDDPLSQQEEWTKATRMKDGRMLNCRCKTLPGGSVMFGFSPGNSARIPALGEHDFRSTRSEEIPATA